MPSALIGQPPETPEDYWIIKGFLRLSGIPDGVVDPSHGLPLPLKRPENYRYETKGPRLLIGTCFAMALIVLITGTRLGLRAFRRDLKWTLDDWIIIPAATCVLSWLSCLVGMISYGGVGKHYFDLTYKEAYWSLRLGTIDRTLFWISVGLIKISIALFNRRLTGLTSQRWMVIHNILLILLVSYVLVAMFLSLFQCRPALVNYDLIKTGKLSHPLVCLDTNSLGIGLSVVHIVFDFVLLSVPIIVLVKVKMDLATKIRIGFLFSVGSISCIGSIMRQKLQTMEGLDASWTIPTQITWTLIDIFFAITAASLPVLNSLLPKHFLSFSNRTFTSSIKESTFLRFGGSSGQCSSHEPKQSHVKYGSGNASRDVSADEEALEKEVEDATEVWLDPGSLVTHSRPTHRDRLHNQSIADMQTRGLKHA